MPNEPVGYEAFKGRTDLCDERFARDNKRLNKMEDAVERISMVDVKLGLLVEQLQKSQEQHDQRISTLEQKPAKRWELVVVTMLTLVLGGAVGFILRSVGMG